MKPSSLLVLVLTVPVSMILVACGGGGSSPVASPVPAIIETPKSPPNPPTISNATAENGSALISFSPSQSGGVATASSYSATCQSSTLTRTSSAAASPITVDGLSNGTSYTCYVVAINSSGNSANSNSINLTPLPSITSAPTSPTPVGDAKPNGPERYVSVGFWQDSSCTGQPSGVTAFPLNYNSDQCFFWPGRSGENSVSRFSCGENTFTYTQWTTLTCTGGQVPTGTIKTVSTSSCIQGVPPTQYAKIIDFSGCAAPVKK